MKRFYYTLLVLVFFCSITTRAQDDRHSKIKALKIAYITDKLSLSTAEAQKFWPIYNEYEETISQLRRVEFNEIKAKFRNQGFIDMSEQEANAVLSKMLDIETQRLEARKKLVAKLKQVFSAKKIILLKKTEDDFNKELLKRLRNNRKFKN